MATRSVGIPRTPRPRPLAVDRAGPFLGMRSTMRGAVDGRFAEWLQNCYPVDPINGGEVVARPGRQSFPRTNLTQLGGTGTDTRLVQLWTPYRKPSNALGGVVAIVAGTMYYGDATGWTVAVDAATLAAAGIVINANSIFGACVFNQKLVVVGPALAWTWDGTANGGVSVLTNAGTSFFGQPTVYAGKLFFIKGDQKTIIWSEEGDEVNGYEAGGFANAWDLRQTSNEPLVALVGTNVALYFFRRRGIGAVYGGSAQDFQTTATLDAVSATEGTDSAFGVVLAVDTIWFLDNEGRPKCFTVGSTSVEPVWHELERAWGSTYEADGRGYQFLAEPNSEKTAFLDFGSIVAHATYYGSLDLVLFSLPYLRTSSAFHGAGDVLLGFHARTRRAQTVWTFPTPINGICETYDPNGGSGAYGLAMVDPYGWPYSISKTVLTELNFPTEAYSDQDHLTSQRWPVIASVIGPRHYEQRSDELRVRRLDVEYVGLVPGALTVRWATPAIMAAGGVAAAEANATLIAPTLPADLAAGGLATDVGSPVPPMPGHEALGLDELCRWIAFGFSWDATATQMRLVGWEVRAVAGGPTPGAY